MHTLLSKLLAKKNITDLKDLDAEERATFDSYERILSKRELTLEEVKQFCKTQVGIIEGKWKDYGMEQTKKAELLPYYTVYKTILDVIQSPQAEREAMEQYLTQLTI